MCGSMADIQSPIAEIRRGKKKEEEETAVQGKNIMSASPTHGGHNKAYLFCKIYSTAGNTNNSSR